MIAARRAIIVLTAAALVLGGFVMAYAWASAHYANQARVSAQSTLSLVAGTVDQTIGRFSPIPSLISGDPDFARVLRPAALQRDDPFLNEKLRQIAISIGASEVYILDRTGRTIAASNYRDADSFLGRNFAFRPYFTEGLAGASSVFHALGTTSGERGFFFSSPILDGIDVIGVLAIKITVDELESRWLGTDHDVLIADANGIVFLASRSAYQFRALAPLTIGTLDRIAQTRQFPIDQLIPLELSANVVAPQTVQVSIQLDGAEERHLAASVPLSLAGWHAIAFTPVAAVQVQVVRALAVGGLALLAVGLVVLVFAQRRASILQRIRLEQEQRAILEDRVRERTADLDAANANLREEVEERRNTEARLRKSQKELIQAGKLAALGQMSAAISHEINQPLAAIKSYADNAVQYLARARAEDAKANLTSIAQMCDRIAEISRHLRTFARQPGEALQPINVAEVITATIGLVGPQLRAQKAQVTFRPPVQPIHALGGKLRLQQVLVNIVNNGLEAMKGQPDPKVDITLEASRTDIRILLRDHGPGLEPETVDRVFDAFYTTKEASVGMGLGLSISQNIISDFGGALEARNHPDGGAEFIVTLQTAEVPAVAEAPA